MSLSYWLLNDWRSPVSMGWRWVPFSKVLNSEKTGTQSHSSLWRVSIRALQCIWRYICSEYNGKDRFLILTAWMRREVGTFYYEEKTAFSEDCVWPLLCLLPYCATSASILLALMSHSDFLSPVIMEICLDISLDVATILLTQHKCIK